METCMPLIRMIADIHLDIDEPERIHNFSKFLEYCQQDHAQVYILGDLFNFWVSDAQAKIKTMQLVLSSLKNFHDKESLYFLSGNRDFMFAPLWKKLGGQVVAEGSKIIVGQENVLLYHGDSFCTNDYIYQYIRKILRFRLVYYISLLLPSYICVKLGQKLRKISSSNVKKKSEFILKFNLEHIRQLMSQKQSQFLICGHAHHAHWLTLSNQHKMCILPESTGHIFRYLEWNNSEWQFQEWPTLCVPTTQFN